MAIYMIRAHMRWLALPISLIAVLLGACSPSQNVTPTSTDDLKITLNTNPSPPRLGDSQLLIDIVNAAGQAVDDVKVDISVGMSSMSMGGTQDGQADSQGKGRYARLVTLHSNGEYVVRLWVRRNGQLLKTQEFRFTVQGGS